MTIIFIIFLVIWGFGFERLGRKYSKETLSSLFGFSPAQTTIKGYFIMGLWTTLVLFLLGLIAMAVS